MKKNLTYHRKAIFPTLYVICLIGVILFSSLKKKTHAQEAYQLQELFMDAESWFYFQDYKNSLPLYLRVHEAYPENDNINYKIGFCYLNIDGQKDKAIPYLEKAAQNTTFNFSEEAFYEKEAPVDAIFYLANAYLINNQLDEALETYEKFEEKVKNRKTIFRRIEFDYEYLQKQKQSCRNARELMSKPINYTAENLGLPINTPQSEYNPIISGDGQTLVFTADKKFYTGVFMSKKENGKWGPPINLLPQLGIDGDCETSSISYDGTELYLYREDELDGNIYVSYYENGSWSKIKKLGETINTKYWESHAYITEDGQSLYFTSNREGGFGDLDIYKAERNANGTWKSPENLGKPINTKWREDTPFLTADGNTLFFSSEGHLNMGGFDIQVAYRTGNEWSKPQNLGYPINTTDDDRFMVPVNQGKHAYYARFNRKAAGQKDIYRYNLSNLETMDFIEVEGVITYQSPENKVQKDFTINIINTNTNDTIAVLKPGKGTEDYTYQLPTGEEHLIYETPMLSNNEQYIISREYEIKEVFSTPKKLAEKEPQKQPEPEINLEKDVFKASSKDENIKIKLQLQGGNKLVVNTFRGGTLVNSEQFSINRDSFIYEYTPDSQESRLTFNLYDNEKSILSKDVNIILDSLAQAQKLSEGTKLNINEKSVSLESGQKRIKIKLSLEKGTDLFVETFVDNKLINTEKFNVNQEDFTYEFEPKEEKSRINFKVIDKDNNIKNQEIVISHKPIDAGLESLLTSLGQMSLAPITALAGTFEMPGITSTQILDSLFTMMQKGKIKSSELNTFLNSATLLKAAETNEFYTELYKLADADIQAYFDTYNQNDLETNEDVIALLNQGIQEGDITEEAYQNLLKKYIASKYTTDELQTLLDDLAGININSIFSELGSNALDIVTIQDLVAKIQQSENNQKEQILALLNSMKIQNKQYQLNVRKKPAEPQQLVHKESTSKSIQYILAAFVGLILILFMLFLIRRRKANNSKN